mmetsp:Transcript_3186/g.7737  ORF Transcript_3186/g.7737 Transcript_3186/m.7737 type:complete len:496 (+) Transcript_3186:117-1604(+)
MKLDAPHKKHLDRPVTLQVQCNIQSINNVDTSRQTFEATFCIVAVLPDVGQCDAHGNVIRDGPFICPAHGGGELTAENWDPRLHLENLADMKSKWHSSARRIVEDVHEAGQDVRKIHWKYKYNGIAVFTDQMQLSRFPYDWQRLSIRVISSRPYQKRDSGTGETRGVMRLMPPSDIGAGTFNISAFPLSNVFDIDSPHVTATPTTTSPLMSSVCSIHPKIKFSVVMKRRPKYYINTALLPMFFITAVGMSSFAIPIQSAEGEYAVGDKLAVSVTAMLGGVVFRFSSSAELPQLGYLTYMDWYLLSCEITQYMTVAQNVIGYRYYEENDGSDFADKVSQGLVLGIFVLVQLFCLAALVWMKVTNTQVTIGEFVQTEKASRVLHEKRLFKKVRRTARLYTNAGVTGTFESEEREGHHSYLGLGSPLTDARDKQLFSGWAEFDHNASDAPADYPREDRYPDGHAAYKGKELPINPIRTPSLASVSPTEGQAAAAPLDL